MISRAAMKKLAITTVLLVPSCSPSSSKTDVAGTYAAYFKGDVAVLVLNADHTCRQTITGKDGKVINNMASWNTVVMGPDEVVIEFSKFHIIPSYSREKADEINWSTSVERTLLGALQFCFDSDSGYCYVRQSRP